MNKPLSFKVMLLLALVQAVFGLLRAYDWVQIGANLFRQGLLLMPMIGTAAVMRGLVISVLALLYVLFVVGALLEKSWARWVCGTAAVLNLLLVLSAVVQGGPLAQAIAWSVIPVILLFYLFSATKSGALKSA